MDSTSDVPPRDVDVCVLGGTPAGIAAAVRAAREGTEVLIVTYNPILGGMLASGIAVSDAQYKAPRAPIYDEFVAGVREQYRTGYGPDSEPFEACNDGYTFEPNVAETVWTDLVDAEVGVSVLWRHHPTEVRREGRRLHAITVAPIEGEGEREIRADTFVDATYEGDLAATAGVPYRLGRESRDAYGEPHAGRLFTRIERSEEGYPRVAADGDLNVNPFPMVSTEIFAGSTGEGDDAIQSYTSRLCLSRDPANRRRPEKPDGYDRERYAGVLRDEPEMAEESHPIKSRVLMADPEEWEAGIPSVIPLPNEKCDWNAGNLVGGSREYPEADWAERREIVERHHRHSLGLLYFLQNDDAVSDAVQERAREWGLALDEYTDNDNRPHQIYVREARRIEGRTAFTEHDARLAPDLDRTPLQEDSIAIADWTMDCHDVRPARQRGSSHDGDFFLTEATRPSQVPFGSILPEGLDDLLVPVALSASHVGFQTLRLEPTWCGIGEAAGMAAALALETGETPGTLDVDRLQGALAERRQMLTFVNDCDMATDEPWVEAVQYLGTKGFFPGYDVHPDDPLDSATADRWVRAVGDLLAGTHEAAECARDIAALEAADATGGTVTAETFADALAEVIGVPSVEVTAVRENAGIRDGPLSRGEAARLVYRVVDPGA